VGRDGAGATGFGAAGADFFFLGADLRAAVFTRRASFLPAFRAFLAAAFTFRFTLATRPLARGRVLRAAFLRGLAALRADFFFAGFRADFFLAAALAMHHLHE
jgi:hypothetical protein